jgi:hypothetical protein
VRGASLTTTHPQATFTSDGYLEVRVAQVPVSMPVNGLSDGQGTLTPFSSSITLGYSGSLVVDLTSNAISLNTHLAATGFQRASGVATVRVLHADPVLYEVQPCDAKACSCLPCVCLCQLFCQ